MTRAEASTTYAPARQTQAEAVKLNVIRGFQPPAFVVPREDTPAKKLEKLTEENKMLRQDSL